MRLFQTFILIILFGCSQPSEKDFGWKLTFENDAEGKTKFGNKEDLMKAVRLGYPIRIGWGGSSVEHVSDASFLTILAGKEVFAQINPIIGQRPIIEGDSMKIVFRMENRWTKLVGTNGYSTAFMIDYLQDTIAGGGNDRQSATSWYVNYPSWNANEIPVKPLWREDSPLWLD